MVLRADSNDSLEEAVGDSRASCLMEEGVLARRPEMEDETYSWRRW